jgi:hypothetical protein
MTTLVVIRALSCGVYTESAMQTIADNAKQHGLLISIKIIREDQ